MLSDGALEITMAHSQDFNSMVFLQDFTNEELEEALKWFRQRKPKSSGRRQRLILEEMDRRSNDANYYINKDPFDKRPEEKRRFREEWADTCRSLQRRMGICG